MIRFSIVALVMAVACNASLTARAQTTPVIPAATPAKTTTSLLDSTSETGTLPGAAGDKPIFYYNLPFTPMQLHGGPLIHVLLNGKLDTLLLLDTATNTAHLRPDVVTALGITEKKLDVPGLNGAKATKAEGITVDTLSIGSYIRSSNADFLVDTRFTSSANIVDPSVSGIFSVDPFIGLSLLFDFEKQTLSFIPASSLTTVQLVALGIPEGTSAIEMKPSGDPTAPEFSIKAHVTGEEDTYFEDTFLLDTGNGRTVILSDPSRLKITPLMNASLVGIHGETSNAIGVINTIQIGESQHASGMAAIVHTECQFWNPRKKLEWQCSNLGMDFLSHFRVLIDFPARKIYFAPLLHGNDLMYPTETARVCGERLIYDAIFKPSATGQWAVDTLRPVLQGRGYFEAKGVQQGDVIVAIQGMKTDGLLPDELARQIVKYTDKLTLTVLRDGKAVNLK